MKKAETVLGLLLLALFATLFSETLNYRWQVALAPRLATGAGVVLALWHLARTFLVKHNEKDSASTYGFDDLYPVAGFLAAVTMVILFGFVVGGTAFVFLSILSTSRWNWKLAILCAAPVPVVLHFGFHIGLKMQIFEGLVTIQGLT